MKYPFISLLYCLSTLVVAPLAGQYQIGLIPRISPDKAVYQKVGYTEVEVRYGSPSVNDRQIWGDLEPYDAVWRAGANNATSVSFSHAVTIAGSELDSGTYALFVIPRESEKWTIIFNKIHKQWGAFRYDVEQDALRVDLPVNMNASKTEHLTYSIRQDRYAAADIVLAWDAMKLSIPFETQYAELFKSEVEARAAERPVNTRWVVLLQGAEYLEETNTDMALAEQWINQAEELMNEHTSFDEKWNENFYPRDYIKAHLYWTKAHILVRQNKYSEAISTAKKIPALENTKFYGSLNEDGSYDDAIEAWRSKL